MSIMNTVTLTRKEYEKLVEAKLRYDYMRSTLEHGIASPPPVRSSKVILKNFRATKLYNKKFLKALEGGLRRSSFFRS